jgi:pyruvate dehydrogenase complex dehydrogenase (E1) component
MLRQRHFQGADKDLALGGHIATYAACATMLEVLSTISCASAPPTTAATC